MRHKASSRLIILTALLLAVSSLTVSVGLAQEGDGLDYSLPATYGQIDLVTGFTPDPYTIDAVAGGNVNAYDAVGGDCWGYVTAAPAVDLRWSGEASRIRIYFVGDGDTTLVVNDPYTDWRCSDDSFDTLHPTVEITDPIEGAYDIWIGSYSEGETISGTLYITELDLSPAGFGAETAPEAEDTLDYSLDAYHGLVELETRFTPDPYVVQVKAGGTVDLFEATGGECQGYAMPAPDLDIRWQSDSGNMRVFFVGEGDATLLINDPYTNWLCSDDSYETMHPSIELTDLVERGGYDIWVGSYSEDMAFSGTLYVTEGDLTPKEIVADMLPVEGEGLDYSLDANYGSTELSAGFTPDPFEVLMKAGGPVDVSEAIEGDCPGFVTRAPDFDLRWSGDSSRIRVFFVGDGDTALIINDPHTNWLCSDDTYDTIHPSIDLDGLIDGGAYDIWVGTFGGGAPVNGTLYITELDLTPADFSE